MFDDKDAKFLKNNTLKIIHSHNKPARERQGKFCFKDYIATPFVLLPITIAPRCASTLIKRTQKFVKCYAHVYIVVCFMSVSKIDRKKNETNSSNLWDIDLSELILDITHVCI